MDRDDKDCKREQVTPLEIRYRWTRHDDVVTINRFRNICDATDRDPKKVLLSLLKNWVEEEQTRLAKESNDG